MRGFLSWWLIWSSGYQLSLMFCPLLQCRSAYRSEVWMFDCCVDELCSDAPDDHIKRLRQKRSSYFSSFCSDSRINVVIVCFSTRRICWSFTSLHVLLFRHKHSVRVQIITASINWVCRHKHEKCFRRSIIKQMFQAADFPELSSEPPAFINTNTAGECPDISSTIWFCWYKYG